MPIQFHIAGFAHTKYLNNHEVPIGRKFALVPDEGNQYDKTAIRVTDGDVVVGWVPRVLGSAKDRLYARLVDRQGTPVVKVIATTQSTVAVECHESLD